MKKFKIGFMLIVSALILAACGTNENESTNEANEQNEEVNQTNENEQNEETNSEEMEHSSSGEVPEGLEEATNPTYDVGNQAIITTDHMEGMEGAEATIVGAYDTIAYVVSYTPNNGGEKVENHKWVIHEEIEDADDEKIEDGEEVKLEADHMEGMEGVEATIDSSEDTTVYMIDYESTTNNEEVKNHKWVTDDELEDE